MSPQDFLYDQTFRQFIAMGYCDRDAGYVAADAVKRWRQKGGASKALEAAITHGKKAYRKCR